MVLSTDLESFQRYLIDSPRILALVGAGLSASSGLATFRGKGGLWRSHDAIDLATPDAFQRDPSLVWQFYSYRRHTSLRARPNKGHYALAELANRKRDFLTLTQNVDGLSQRAGHPAEKLLNLHGDLFTVKCTEFMCSYVGTSYDDPIVPALSETETRFPTYTRTMMSMTSATSATSASENDNDNDDSGLSDSSLMRGDLASAAQRRRPQHYRNNVEKKRHPQNDQTNASSSHHIDKDDDNTKYIKQIPESELPHCPLCKVGLLRPGVVWFGEPLPFREVTMADKFLMEAKVDLILVIGTSCSVWPAAGYVERVARSGGKVAVFNTEISADMDDMEEEDIDGWAFKGDAAEWLPKALEPIIGDSFIPRQ